jgi:adenylate cyclase
MRDILNYIKAHKSPLALSSVVLILSLTIYATGILSPVSNLVNDALFIPQASNELVGIVAIDESSLEELGAWPWDREEIAIIISNLNEVYSPRVIALDITFFEQRDGDGTLQEVINNSDARIILAGKVDNSDYLTSHIESLNGFVNLDADIDEKVRYTDIIRDIGGQTTPSFAYQSFLSYFGINYSDQFNPPTQVGFTEIQDVRQIINFQGGSGNINTVSAANVFNNLDTALPKDGIIYVGSTVQDLKQNLDDRFVTPLGIMPGVEIHAQITSSMLDNQLFVIANPVVTAILIAFVSLVGFISMKRLSLRSFILLFGMLFISYALVVLVLFNFNIRVDLFYSLIHIVFVTILGITWKYFYGKKENTRIKRAFSQYINDDLLNQILLDPSHLQLGGIRKNMTVMFSDIRGFTSISEKIEPEELVHFLNDYLTAATQEIFNHNGTVDKYLGDAIMALWNAPLDDDLHAINACNSSLSIIDVLEEFNKSTEAGISELKIGIGVNTGDMVVGNMGSELRFDYTAMGDNVNLSSRLEGLTKQYAVSIILGEGTVENIRKNSSSKSLNVRHLDTVTVKGKAKPIKIYQLIHTSESIDPEKIIKPYEEALLTYLDGRFEAAAEKFDSLHQQYSDKTSEIMRDRCLKLKSTKKDWPGYWKWDTK